jgi:hypothetical protein
VRTANGGLGRVRKRSHTGVSSHFRGLWGGRHGEKREEGGQISEKGRNAYNVMRKKIEWSAANLC